MYTPHRRKHTVMGLYGLYILLILLFILFFSSFFTFQDDGLEHYVQTHITDAC